MTPVTRVVIILSCVVYTLSGANIPVEEECIEEESTETTLTPTTCPYPETEVANVALNKDARQSSTYSEYDAHKAVDGNTSQSFYPERSCTHTTMEPDTPDIWPWLIVDLQDRYVVQYVKLYSRDDSCCAHRYHDLEVRVGDEMEYGLGNQFFKNPVCGHFRGGGFPIGHTFYFNCTACQVGHFVSVQIIDDLRNKTEGNILSICELEVYGYPAMTVK